MSQPDLSPFFFPGNHVGCLLIHGLSNTPYEMRGMGQYLAEKGLTVLGVRLAGHGTTPEEMAQTTWRHWVASALAGLEELRRGCSRLFLVGASGGGLISLYLALHQTVDGAVVISTPVYLDDWRLLFLPLLRYFVPWYRDPLCDLTDPGAWARYYAPPASYERKPVSSLPSFRELQGLVKKGLKRIAVPILLIYGARDRMVPLGNARYIYENLGSTDKELIWLPNSGHGLVVDSEKKEAWAKIYEFIDDHR